MRKKKEITMEVTEFKESEPGTIGALFDYYRKKGYDKLPGKVTINATNFKSNK